MNHNSNDPDLQKIYDLMKYYPQHKPYILNEINTKSEYITYKELYYHIDEYILENEYMIQY